MKLLLSFIVLSVCCMHTELFGQTSYSPIDNFFRELVSDTSDMSGFADADEVASSLRLGINYEGVKNKFLISYDIDKEVKGKINNGSYKYELKSKKLENDFEKATFFVPGLNYSKDFYFKGNKYISPITYFTRNWKKFSTRYFNFAISDTSYFNTYSADQLEQFTEGMLSLLRIKDNDKNLLRSNKITYIFCKDSAEIKQLTGFNTRGIYILADDQIISTFNCHFHELAHLLINYKIRRLPLFTLPFLQEGFASATGGRGGIARSVILDIGYFLDKSGYIPYNSLISFKDFSSEDASVTYPVAALYSLFLMNELGMEPYIDLYRSYSGNYDYISGIKTNEVKLPSKEKYTAFLNKFRRSEDIIPESRPDLKNKIYSGNTGQVYDEKEYYLFRIKGNIYLRSKESFPGYISKKFKELYPDQNYPGAKYLIQVGSREVNIYNLFTNNLIASYSTGLAVENKNVPLKDGYFEFLVKKNIFNEGLDQLEISGL